MDHDQIIGLQGATVTDPTGDKIGTVDQIYLDDETQQPEFATVNTGLFGLRSSFVPITGAQFQGNDVCVAYPKDKVKDAPKVDANEHLSQRQEAELYEYYGLPYSEQKSDSGLPDAAPTSDASQDAMTRSEEELQIDKEKQPREKVRLRKFVVTENVQQTVPVQREEVRVEREPITEANLDQATSGPEITESEHEVTLNEEQVVTQKKTVPKEQVRLSKDTVSDEEKVNEELRKEQIETQTESLK